MPRFRRNLWLLLLQNLSIFIGIAVQALILNLYLVALGYREDFIGLVAFAQTAAIGVGALPASSLSARFGARRTLIWATVALSGSFAAMGQLEDPIAILIASVVSGAAMAHIFVPSAPYLADNTAAEERRTAFAANFAALSLASIAGSTLGGALPSLVAAPGEVAGYRAALLVGSALTALGTLWLFAADDTRLEPSIAPPAPPAPVGSAATARPSTPDQVRRDVIAMVVATALLAASTALVVAFFNVYLTDVVHASISEVGVVFTAGAVAMAPASLIGPAAARRYGSLATIVVPRLLTVPLILALAFGPPVLSLGLIVSALRSALVSISQPLDNAFAMELVSPRDRTRVAALRTVSWNGGWALATVVGGRAILLVGYPTIFAIAALLTLASAAVHWWTFRDR